MTTRFDLTRRTTDSWASGSAPGYSTLHYPHVIQYLMPGFGLIHQIVVEEQSGTSDVSVEWQGKNNAWLILRHPVDETWSDDRRNKTVVDFLRDYAREKNRTIWFVEEPEAGVEITADGKAVMTGEIPTKGLLILLSSMDPDSDAFNLELE